jgi:hypothetical protein
MKSMKNGKSFNNIVFMGFMVNDLEIIEVKMGSFCEKDQRPEKRSQSKMGSFCFFVFLHFGVPPFFPFFLLKAILRIALCWIPLPHLRGYDTNKKRTCSRKILNEARIQEPER